jgi:hypothetical protein
MQQYCFDTTKAKEVGGVPITLGNTPTIHSNRVSGFELSFPFQRLGYPLFGKWIHYLIALGIWMKSVVAQFIF